MVCLPAVTFSRNFLLPSSPSHPSHFPWQRRPTYLPRIRRPPAFLSFSFDLTPPPIDHDLLEALEVEGAKMLGDGSVGTFGNDDSALNAAYDGVAVADLSHFGRIRVTGKDRSRFLHSQTTANFEAIQIGQGCDTVFVTPTARTIDIANAWVMKNSIMLLVSPDTCQSITEMLNKYIFFADEVEVQDITYKTCFFVVIGPKSSQVMQYLNLSDLVGQPYGTHRHYSVNGVPVTVGVGSVTSEDGYSLLLSPAAAGSIWSRLLDFGAVPMGTLAWERLRVLLGRPAAGKELTDSYNVLEAGLWKTISLNKGCYKGQETISRLITYNGIKQKLWGIKLSGPVKPGSSITMDNKKVGLLTSYANGKSNGEHFGLGYIKKRDSLVGDEVYVNDVVGILVEVPYLDSPPTKLTA